MAWLGAALSGLLVAVACWRSLAGQFEPLPLGPLALAALVATCGSLVARLTLFRASRLTWIELLPVLLLAAFAGSLSVPGTSAAGYVLLWASIVGGELVYWPLRTQVRLQRLLRPGLTRPAGPWALARWAPQLGEPEAELETAGLLAHASLMQRTVRSLEDGYDTLYGEFRCHFAARERSQALHITFCPPFAELPELFVESFDGPAVELKTTQLQPFGARFDLRLTQCSDGPTSVAVRVVARHALSRGDNLNSSDGPAAPEDADLR